MPAGRPPLLLVDTTYAPWEMAKAIVRGLASSWETVG
jgi:hypothetical protein